MKVTLKNDFHRTEATVIAKAFRGKYIVENRQYRRAAKKLCPSLEECTCGVIRGGRFGLESCGGNYYEVFFKGWPCLPKEGEKR